ncbi:unnamed protein product [Ixodes hexagonus]
MASSSSAMRGARMYHSITVVDETSQSISIVDSLLKCKMLGLDAEGVAPRKRGMITMITLATHGRHVYIFDVQKAEELFEDGNLRLLLESANAIKVVHDFRNIAETLNNTFGVKVRKIFDTHVAYQTTLIQKGICETNALSMDDLFALYSKPVNPESANVKRTVSSEPKCFASRPITKWMAYYTAFNVCCLLVYVYEEQVRRIRLKYWPLLAALNEDTLGHRTNSEDLVEEALLQADKDQERDQRDRPR